MPIREYISKIRGKCCRHCVDGFEVVEAIDAEPIERCPRCGELVSRQLSAPSVGASKSGLHDRAKSAGFTTYEKLGTGEYEKKY